MATREQRLAIGQQAPRSGTGTKPIAQTYDASGNAIPDARGVNAGGRTFDVSRRDNVFSFLLISKSNSIAFNIKPLADYCVAHGWVSASVSPGRLIALRTVTLQRVN